MSSNEKNTKKNIIASVYEWVEVICVALFAVVLLFTFVFRLVTVDGPSMNDTLQHGDRLIISDLFYKPKTGDVVVLQDANSKYVSGPIIKRVIATEGETVNIDPETWTVTVTDTEGNIRVLDEDYAKRIYVLSLPVSETETLEINLATKTAVVSVANSFGLDRTASVEEVDENNIKVIVDKIKTYNINTKTLETSVTDVSGKTYDVNKEDVTKSLVNMRVGTFADTAYYTEAIMLNEYPHTVEKGRVFVMGDNRNNSLDSRFIGDIDERMILGKAYLRVLPNPRVGFN